MHSDPIGAFVQPGLAHLPCIGGGRAWLTLKYIMLRTKKPRRLASPGSSTWHPHGDSNPGLQDENLIS